MDGESPKPGIKDKIKGLWFGNKEATEAQKFAADAAANLPHNLHAGEPMPGEGAIRDPEDDKAVEQRTIKVPPHIPFHSDESTKQPGEGPVDPATLAEDIGLMDERYAQQGRLNEASNAPSMVVKTTGSPTPNTQSPQQK